MILSYRTATNMSKTQTLDSTSSIAHADSSSSRLGILNPDRRVIQPTPRFLRSSRCHARRQPLSVDHDIRLMLKLTVAISAVGALFRHCAVFHVHVVIGLLAIRFTFFLL